MEEKWRTVYQEGQYYLTLNDLGNHAIPDFYDKAKLSKCVKLFKSNFTSSITSIYYGLVLAAGKLGFTGPHLFKRSVSDIERMTRFVIAVNYNFLVCITGDMFEPNSKAYQSTRNIRSIHSHIAKKMNERDGRVEKRDVVWLNQVEMLLLMMRSFSIGVLFPTLSVSFVKNVKQKEELYYFSRNILYSLGVEDRFNVFGWTTEEIDWVMAKDFWDNIYPMLNDKEIAAQIKANTLHKEVSENRTLDQLPFIWQQHLHYLSSAIPISSDVLDQKPSKLFLFVRYLFEKLPSCVTIWLTFMAHKYKNGILKLIIKMGGSKYRNK